MFGRKQKNHAAHNTWASHASIYHSFAWNATKIYELWFPLLDFVNQKYQVCPGMGTIDWNRGVDAAEAKKIADYLWSHAQVLQKYIA